MFRGNKCTYCGDPASSMDHVVPVSWGQVSRKGASYSRRKVVPSCSECNNTLGNIKKHTVADRAEYLLDRYLFKYNKILCCPKWTDEEIEELGYNLKTIILQQNMHQKILEQRMTWIEQVILTNPTIKEVWEEINAIKYKAI